MPIFEYECPEHHIKVERIVVGKIEKPNPLCECGRVMQLVEFSVPARRDPEKGIQT